jgi:uncharacterized protein YjbI with pentapeptide repeats
VEPPTPGSGDETAPQPPTPEALQSILKAHDAWVRSRGRDGRQADFQGIDLSGADLRGANLRQADLRGVPASKADLSGARLCKADLRGANLSEAKLKGADLSRADLREAELYAANLAAADLTRADLRQALIRRATLRDANLTDADLSDVRGLLSNQIGGANLAGSKLPADILKFEGLANVAEASKATQSLFTSMVFVCAYTWLTIASTTDSQLLNNAAPPSSRLPILGIDIPLVRFYIVAPLLLLCLYVYFQLGLQRLWEELSELPAVFPDGRTLDKKAYPWLLNILVRAHLPRLREGRSHLAKWQTRISVMLAWGLVPATILLAWGRYLPAHDWYATSIHLALLAASAGAGVAFLRLASSTLRGSERRSFMWKRAWKDARALGFGVTVATAAALYVFSVGVIEGVYAKSVYDDKMIHRLYSRYYRLDARRWLPQVLDRLGMASSANLNDANLSTKPANWSPGHPEMLDAVKGADLEHRNLRHAMAYNAFAANAYIQQSDLRWADFREADLRRADFRQADLRGVNFRFSNLSGADFRRKANLTDARFKEAIAENSRFEEAILRNATLADSSFRGANFTKADLSGADLTNSKLDPLPAAEATKVPKPTLLAGANLSRAKLINTNLAGADLTGASLRDADLTGADLDKAILKGADLTGAKGVTTRQLGTAITDARTRPPRVERALADRRPLGTR